MISISGVNFSVVQAITNEWRVSDDTGRDLGIHAHNRMTAISMLCQMIPPAWDPTVPLPTYEQYMEASRQIREAEEEADRIFALETFGTL